MNATLKHALVFVLCLVGTGAIHQSQSESTIEGVVLEAATNRPLRGVRVSLLDSPEPEFIFGALPTVGSGAVTDDQGRFRIEAPAGRFRVVPSLDGYVFSRPERLRAPREPGVWISVGTGQRVEGVELHLVREAVIRGVVLDASGQAVPGGSAFLSRYRYDRYGSRRLSGIPGVYYPGSAYSFVRFNDRGEFRLYGLPPGDYYLRLSGGRSNVFYPGTTDESKAVEIHLNPGQEKDVGTITLPPAERRTPVRFRLMNGEEPISGGMVSIQYGDASMLILGRPGQEDVTVSLVPGFYDMVVATGMLGRQSLFARLSLQVGDSEIEQQVSLRSGFRLTTSLAMEEVGGQRPVTGVRCQLYQESPYALVNCYQDQLVVPGLYRLELTPPEDAYIVSATVSDRDVLRDGLELQTDTELQIVLATPGAVLTGKVSSTSGESLPDAVVALVPDAPLRNAGPLYRSGASDQNGSFELRGVAPGSYRLFAWPELEGAAYRDAPFMKQFEDGGKAVKIERPERISVDITASP
jgi:hypothetical protein